MRATAGWWRRPQSHLAQWCVWPHCCAWSGCLPAGCWTYRPLCLKPVQEVQSARTANMRLQLSFVNQDCFSMLLLVIKPTTGQGGRFPHQMKCKRNILNISGKTNWHLYRVLQANPDWPDQISNLFILVTFLFVHSSIRTMCWNKQTLLRAPAPVRMMWEFSTWITLCPKRTRYAPMPIARHVTCKTMKRDSGTSHIGVHELHLRAHEPVTTSYHTDCDNLLVGLRGFSSNHARTSQVLNPKTIILPDNVCDDVPGTDGWISNVLKISISWNATLWREQPMIPCTWTHHLPLHGDSEQRWWSWSVCSLVVSSKGT